MNKKSKKILQAGIITPLVGIISLGFLIASLVLTTKIVVDRQSSLDSRSLAVLVGTGGGGVSCSSGSEANCIAVPGCSWQEDTEVTDPYVVPTGGSCTGNPKQAACVPNWLETSCSKECGGGKKTKYDANCSGSVSETIECNTQACVEEPVVVSDVGHPGETTDGMAEKPSSESIDSPATGGTGSEAYTKQMEANAKHAYDVLRELQQEGPEVPDVEPEGFILTPRMEEIMREIREMRKAGEGALDSEAEDDIITQLEDVAGTPRIGDTSQLTQQDEKKSIDTGGGSGVCGTSKGTAVGVGEVVTGAERGGGENRYYCYGDEDKNTAEWRKCSQIDPGCVVNYGPQNIIEAEFKKDIAKDNNISVDEVTPALISQAKEEQAAAQQQWQDEEDKSCVTVEGTPCVGGNESVTILDGKLYVLITVQRDFLGDLCRGGDLATGKVNQCWVSSDIEKEELAGKAFIDYQERDLFLNVVPKVTARNDAWEACKGGTSSLECKEALNVVEETGGNKNELLIDLRESLNTEEAVEKVGDCYIENPNDREKCDTLLEKDGTDLRPGDAFGFFIVGLSDDEKERIFVAAENTADRNIKIIDAMGFCTIKGLTGDDCEEELKIQNQDLSVYDLEIVLQGADDNAIWVQEQIDLFEKDQEYASEIAESVPIACLGDDLNQARACAEYMRSLENSDDRKIATDFIAQQKRVSLAISACTGSRDDYESGCYEARNALTSSEEWNFVDEEIDKREEAIFVFQGDVLKELKIIKEERENQVNQSILVENIVSADKDALFADCVERNGISYGAYYCNNKFTQSDDGFFIAYSNYLIDEGIIDKNNFDSHVFDVLDNEIGAYNVEKREELLEYFIENSDIPLDSTSDIAFDDLCNLALSPASGVKDIHNSALDPCWEAEEAMSEEFREGIKNIPEGIVDIVTGIGESAEEWNLDNKRDYYIKTNTVQITDWSRNPESGIIFSDDPEDIRRVLELDDDVDLNKIEEYIYGEDSENVYKWLAIDAVGNLVSTDFFTGDFTEYIDEETLELRDDISESAEAAIVSWISHQRENITNTGAGGTIKSETYGVDPQFMAAVLKAQGKSIEELAGGKHVGNEIFLNIDGEGVWVDTKSEFAEEFRNQFKDTLFEFPKELSDVPGFLTKTVLGGVVYLPTVILDGVTDGAVTEALGSASFTFQRWMSEERDPDSQAYEWDQMIGVGGNTRNSLPSLLADQGINIDIYTGDGLADLSDMQKLVFDVAVESIHESLREEARYEDRFLGLAWENATVEIQNLGAMAVGVAAGFGTAVTMTPVGGAIASIIVETTVNAGTQAIVDAITYTPRERLEDKLRDLAGKESDSIKAKGLELMADRAGEAEQRIQTQDMTIGVAADVLLGGAFEGIGVAARLKGAAGDAAMRLAKLQAETITVTGKELSEGVAEKLAKDSTYILNGKTIVGKDIGGALKKLDLGELGSITFEEITKEVFDNSGKIVADAATATGRWERLFGGVEDFETEVAREITKELGDDVAEAFFNSRPKIVSLGDRFADLRKNISDRFGRDEDVFSPQTIKLTDVVDEGISVKIGDKIVVGGKTIELKEGDFVRKIAEDGSRKSFQLSEAVVEDVSFKLGQGETLEFRFNDDFGNFQKIDEVVSMDDLARQVQGGAGIVPGSRITVKIGDTQEVMVFAGIGEDGVSQLRSLGTGERLANTLGFGKGVDVETGDFSWRRLLGGGEPVVRIEEPVARIAEDRFTFKELDKHIQGLLGEKGESVNIDGIINVKEGGTIEVFDANGKLMHTRISDNENYLKRALSDDLKEGGYSFKIETSDGDVRWFIADGDEINPFSEKATLGIVTDADASASVNNLGKKIIPEGEKAFRLAVPEGASDDLAKEIVEYNALLDRFESHFGHHIYADQLRLLTAPEEILQLQAGGGKTKVIGPLLAAAERRSVTTLSSAGDARAYVNDIMTQKQFFEEEGIDIFYFDKSRGFLEVGSDFDQAKANIVDINVVKEAAERAASNPKKHGISIITESSNKAWALIEGDLPDGSLESKVLYEMIKGKGYGAGGYTLLADEIGDNVNGVFSLSRGTPKKLSELAGAEDASVLLGLKSGEEIVDIAVNVRKTKGLKDFTDKVTAVLKKKGNVKEALFHKVIDADSGIVVYRPIPKDPKVMGESFADILDQSIKKAKEIPIDDLSLNDKEILERTIKEMEDLSVELGKDFESDELSDQLFEQFERLVQQTGQSSAQRDILADLSFRKASLQSAWAQLSRVPDNQLAQEGVQIVLRKSGETTGEAYSAIADKIALHLEGEKMLDATGLRAQTDLGKTIEIIDIGDLEITPDSHQITNAEIYQGANKLRGYDATPTTAANKLGKTATGPSERPPDPARLFQGDTPEALIEAGYKNSEFTDSIEGKAKAFVIGDGEFSYKQNTDAIIDNDIKIKRVYRAKHVTEKGGGKHTEYFEEIIIRNADGVVTREGGEILIEQKAWSNAIQRSLIENDPESILIVYEGRIRAVDLEVTAEHKDIRWSEIIGDQNTMEDLTQQVKRNRAMARTDAELKKLRWTDKEIAQSREYTLFVRSHREDLTPDNVVDYFKDILDDRLATTRFENTIQRFAGDRTSSLKAVRDEIISGLPESERKAAGEYFDEIINEARRVERASAIEIQRNPLKGDDIKDEIYNRGKKAHNELLRDADDLESRFNVSKLVDSEGRPLSLKERFGVNEDYISKEEFDELLKTAKDASIANPVGSSQTARVYAEVHVHNNDSSTLPKFGWHQKTDSDTVKSLVKEVERQIVDVDDFGGQILRNVLDSSALRSTNLPALDLLMGGVRGARSLINRDLSFIGGDVGDLSGIDVVHRAMVITDNQGETYSLDIETNFQDREGLQKIKELLEEKNVESGEIKIGTVIDNNLKEMTFYYGTGLENLISRGADLLARLNPSEEELEEPVELAEEIEDEEIEEEEEELDEPEGPEEPDQASEPETPEPEGPGEAVVLDEALERLARGELTRTEVDELFELIKEAPEKNEEFREALLERYRGTLGGLFQQINTIGEDLPYAVYSSTALKLHAEEGDKRVPRDIDIMTSQAGIDKLYELLKGLENNPIEGLNVTGFDWRFDEKDKDGVVVNIGSGVEEKTGHRQFKCYINGVEIDVWTGIGDERGDTEIPDIALNFGERSTTGIVFSDLEDVTEIELDGVGIRAFSMDAVRMTYTKLVLPKEEGLEGTKDRKGTFKDFVDYYAEEAGVSYVREMEGSLNELTDEIDNIEREIRELSSNLDEVTEEVTEGLERRLTEVRIELDDFVAIANGVKEELEGQIDEMRDGEQKDIIRDGLGEIESRQNEIEDNLSDVEGDFDELKGNVEARDKGLLNQARANLQNVGRAVGNIIADAVDNLLDPLEAVDLLRGNREANAAAVQARKDLDGLGFNVRTARGGVPQTSSTLMKALKPLEEYDLTADQLNKAANILRTLGGNLENVSVLARNEAKEAILEAAKAENMARDKAAQEAEADRQVGEELERLAETEKQELDTLNNLLTDSGEIELGNTKDNSRELIGIIEEILRDPNYSASIKNAVNYAEENGKSLKDVLYRSFYSEGDISEETMLFMDQSLVGANLSKFIEKSRDLMEIGQIPIEDREIYANLSPYWYEKPFDNSELNVSGKKLEFNERGVHAIERNEGTENVGRIYLNVNYEYLPIIFKEIENRLIELDLQASMKMINVFKNISSVDSRLMSRPDSMVLYFSANDKAKILEILEEVNRRSRGINLGEGEKSFYEILTGNGEGEMGWNSIHKEAFREDIPKFTGQLMSVAGEAMKGISFVQNRASFVSFGEVISSIFSEMAEKGDISDINYVKGNVDLYFSSYNRDEEFPFLAEGGRELFDGILNRTKSGLEAEKAADRKVAEAEAAEKAAEQAKKEAEAAEQAKREGVEVAEEAKKVAEQAQRVADEAKRTVEAAEQAERQKSKEERGILRESILNVVATLSEPLQQIKILPGVNETYSAVAEARQILEDNGIKVTTEKGGAPRSPARFISELERMLEERSLGRRVRRIDELLKIEEALSQLSEELDIWISAKQAEEAKKLAEEAERLSKERRQKAFEFQVMVKVMDELLKLGNQVEENAEKVLYELATSIDSRYPQAYIDGASPEELEEIIVQELEKQDFNDEILRVIDSSLSEEAENIREGLAGLLYVEYEEAEQRRVFIEDVLEKADEMELPEIVVGWSIMTKEEALDIIDSLRIDDVKRVTKLADLKQAIEERAAQELSEAARDQRVVKINSSYEDIFEEQLPNIWHEFTDNETIDWTNEESIRNELEEEIRMKMHDEIRGDDELDISVLDEDKFNSFVAEKTLKLVKQLKSSVDGLISNIGFSGEGVDLLSSLFLYNFDYQSDFLFIAREINPQINSLINDLKSLGLTEENINGILGTVYYEKLHKYFEDVLSDLVVLRNHYQGSRDRKSRAYAEQLDRLITDVEKIQKSQKYFPKEEDAVPAEQVITALSLTERIVRAEQDEQEKLLANLIENEQKQSVKYKLQTQIVKAGAKISNIFANRRQNKEKPITFLQKLWKPVVGLVVVSMLWIAVTMANIGPTTINPMVSTIPPVVQIEQIVEGLQPLIEVTISEGDEYELLPTEEVQPTAEAVVEYEGGVVEFFLGSILDEAQSSRMDRFVAMKPGEQLDFVFRIDAIDEKGNIDTTKLAEKLTSDYITFGILASDEGGEVDTERDWGGQGHADIILVISINPKTGETILMSVPRYLMSPELGGQEIANMTWNPSGTGQIEDKESVREILEDIIATPIDGVFQGNMDSVMHLFNNLFPNGAPVTVHEGDAFVSFSFKDLKGLDKAYAEGGTYVMQFREFLRYMNNRKGQAWKDLDGDGTPYNEDGSFQEGETSPLSSFSRERRTMMFVGDLADFSALIYLADSDGDGEVGVLDMPGFAQRLFSFPNILNRLEENKDLWIHWDFDGEQGQKSQPYSFNEYIDVYLTDLVLRLIDIPGLVGGSNDLVGDIKEGVHLTRIVASSDTWINEADLVDSNTIHIQIVNSEEKITKFTTVNADGKSLEPYSFREDKSLVYWQTFREAYQRAMGQQSQNEISQLIQEETEVVKEEEMVEEETMLPDGVTSLFLEAEVEGKNVNFHPDSIPNLVFVNSGGDSIEIDFRGTEGISSKEISDFAEAIQNLESFASFLNTGEPIRITKVLGTEISSEGTYYASSGNDLLQDGTVLVISIDYTEKYSSSLSHFYLISPEGEVGTNSLMHEFVHLMRYQRTADGKFVKSDLTTAFEGIFWNDSVLQDPNREFPPTDYSIGYQNLYLKAPLSMPLEKAANEDLADSVVLYFTDPDFKNTHPERFAFIDEINNGKNPVALLDEYLKYVQVPVVPLAGGFLASRNIISGIFGEIRTSIAGAWKRWRKGDVQIEEGEEEELIDPDDSYLLAARNAVEKANEDWKQSRIIMGTKIKSHSAGRENYELKDRNYVVGFLDYLRNVVVGINRALQNVQSRFEQKAEEEKGDKNLVSEELALEEKGEILSKNHQFSKLISKVSKKLGVAKDIEVIVLDSDRVDAFYHLKAKAIVISRGYAKYLLEQGLDLREDHLAAVMAHEIEHANTLGDEYVKRIEDDILQRIASGYIHAEEYRADTQALRLLAKSGYNPKALIEMHRVFGLTHGRDDAAHPEVIDRIRKLEDALADDKLPIVNTNKEMELLDSSLLQWLSEPSKVYEETEQLLEASLLELEELLIEAKTQEEYWTIYSLIQQKKRVGLAKSFLEQQKEEIVRVEKKLLFYTFLELISDPRINIVHIDGEQTSLGEDKGYLLRQNFSASISQENDIYDIRGQIRNFNDVETVITSQQFNSQIEKYDDGEDILLSSLERLHDLEKRADGFIDQYISSLDYSIFSSEEAIWFNKLIEEYRLGVLAEDVLLSVFYEFDKTYQQQNFERIQQERLDKGRRLMEEQGSLSYDLRKQENVDKFLTSMQLGLSLDVVDVELDLAQDEEIDLLSEILDKELNVSSEESRLISEIIMGQRELSDWEKYLNTLSRQQMTAMLSKIDNLTPNTFLLLSPRRSLHGSYSSSSDLIKWNVNRTEIFKADSIVFDGRTGVFQALKEVLVVMTYQKSFPLGYEKVNVGWISEPGSGVMMRAKTTARRLFEAENSDLTVEEWVARKKITMYGGHRDFSQWLVWQYINDLKEGHVSNALVIENLRKVDSGAVSNMLSLSDLLLLIEKNPWSGDKLLDNIGGRLDYMPEQGDNLKENKLLFELYTKLYNLSPEDDSFFAKKPQFLKKSFNISFIINQQNMDSKTAFIEAIKECEKSGLVLKSILLKSFVLQENLLSDIELDYLIKELIRINDVTTEIQRIVNILILLRESPQESRQQIGEDYLFWNEEVIKSIVNKYGLEASDWVVANLYETFNDRDWLLFSLASLAEDEEMKQRFILTYDSNKSGSTDEDYGKKTSPNFSFAKYSGVKESQDGRTDKFKGIGELKKLFPDLLLRRFAFNTLSPSLKETFEDELKAYNMYQDEYGSSRQKFEQERLILIEEMLLDLDIDIKDRIALLEKTVSFPSIVRDIHLEMMLRMELGSEKNEQEKLAISKQLLLLFTQDSSLKEGFSTQLLRLEISQRREILTNVDEFLDLLVFYKPNSSLARNYFLNLVENSASLTPEKLREISSMRMSDEGKKDDLDTSPQTYIYNRLAELNREEKSKAVLWLLGISQEKSLNIRKIEQEFDGHLDSFPKAVAMMTDDEREVLYKRLLMGAEGIIDLEAVSSSEIETAEEQKKLFLQELSSSLFTEEAPNFQLFRKIFTVIIDSSDVAHGSKLIIKLVNKISNSQIEGVELSSGETISLLLSEMGVVGKKVAQSLAEQEWVPEDYKEHLRKAQTEGEVVSKRALLLYLEDLDLLNENNRIQIISIDELIGAASNKQAVKLTVEIKNRWLPFIKQRRTLVGKFKRPSAQKIDNLEHDLRVLDEVLKVLSQEGVAEVMPKDFSSQISDAVKRELDFSQEADFVKAFTRDVNIRNLFRRKKIFVPKVIYTSSDVIFETEAEGIQLRAYYDMVRMDSQAFQESGYDNLSDQQINQTILSEILAEIISTGRVHADLHPGNIFVNKKGDVSFIDLGSHVILNKSQRMATISLLNGLNFGNIELVNSAFRELKWDIEVSNLTTDLESNIDILLKISQKSDVAPPEEVSMLLLSFSKMTNYFRDVNYRDVIIQVAKIIRKVDYPSVMLRLIKDNSTLRLPESNLEGLEENKSGGGDEITYVNSGLSPLSLEKVWREAAGKTENSTMKGFWNVAANAAGLLAKVTGQTDEGNLFERARDGFWNLFGKRRLLTLDEENQKTEMEIAEMVFNKGSQEGLEKVLIIQLAEGLVVEISLRGVNDFDSFEDMQADLEERFEHTNVNLNLDFLNASETREYFTSSILGEGLTSYTEGVEGKIDTSDPINFWSSSREGEGYGDLNTAEKIEVNSRYRNLLEGVRKVLREGGVEENIQEVDIQEVDVEIEEAGEIRVAGEVDLWLATPPETIIVSLADSGEQIVVKVSEKEGDWQAEDFAELVDEELRNRGLSGSNGVILVKWFDYEEKEQETMIPFEYSREEFDGEQGVILKRQEIEELSWGENFDIFVFF